MKKDFTSVVISFLAVAIVTTAGTFLYQKQLYAAEQLALKITQEEQRAYKKEQVRLAFVVEIERVANVARLAQEEKERKEAAAKALEKARAAKEARMQEEIRIATIVSEAAQQEALSITVAEAQRQTNVLAAQQKAQEIADQLAAKKALEVQRAAETEVQRLAAKKAAANKLATKKKSRRSRAS